MKQIERQGSPQRVICELLQWRPAMTIAEISAARQVHARAVARQLDALVVDGYLAASGYPRRYSRTSRALPEIVCRTPRAEVDAARRQREREALQRRLCHRPTLTDLDRVFAQWGRSGATHA